MKIFSGPVLFLDRGDINTDEIIPAKYLTEISRAALKPYLLEDLVLEGFAPQRDLDGKRIIITRSNFGCGSSREHAPWALQVNGIEAVVAVSFARIFRQNMFNGGMLAIELPENDIDDIFKNFGAAGPASQAEAEIDLDGETLTLSAGGESKSYKVSISGFDRALVEAGGWVEYADSHY